MSEEPGFSEVQESYTGEKWVPIPKTGDRIYISSYARFGRYSKEGVFIYLHGLDRRKPHTSVKLRPSKSPEAVRGDRGDVYVSVSGDETLPPEFTEGLDLLRQEQITLFGGVCAKCATNNVIYTMETGRCRKCALQEQKAKSRERTEANASRARVTHRLKDVDKDGRRLKVSEHPGFDWMKNQVTPCQTNGLDYHSTDPEEQEAAASHCSICPVIEQCLEFALSERYTTGVWGGVQPRELAQELKRRNAEVRNQRKPSNG